MSEENQGSKSSGLDSYLRQHGFALSPEHSDVNEGYSSRAQREAFKDYLRDHPNVKTILEIGFNAGFSCETFLESSEDMSVTSFDINQYRYVNVAREYMQNKYADRFEFIEGDSATSVPVYFKEHPDRKFDLIYIDGDHRFEYVVSDVLNCRKLAHRNTVLWIDDSKLPEVDVGIRYCVLRGIIESQAYLRQVQDSQGGTQWAEAKYIFPSS